MVIKGVSTGVEFENYIKKMFEDEGVRVDTTPASNDYGADLILKKNGVTAAVQCKYYSSSVGVKSVQEVIGALSYYHAKYGVVVSNNMYTQQAKNLADTNGIFLVEGYDLKYDIKKLVRLLFSEDNKDKKGSSTVSVEWVLDDLVIRYGVGKEVIKRDFMSKGMPYYKVGREYRFRKSEVEEWEISEVSVRYGRNGNQCMLLPAYKEAEEKRKQKIEYLKSGLVSAIEAEDYDSVDIMVEDLKKEGVYPYGILKKCLHLKYEEFKALKEQDRLDGLKSCMEYYNISPPISDLWVCLLVISIPVLITVSYILSL